MSRRHAWRWSSSCPVRARRRSARAPRPAPASSSHARPIADRRAVGHRDHLGLREPSPSWSRGRRSTRSCGTRGPHLDRRPRDGRRRTSSEAATARRSSATVGVRPRHQCVDELAPKPRPRAASGTRRPGSRASASWSSPARRASTLLQRPVGLRPAPPTPGASCPPRARAGAALRHVRRASAPTAALDQPRLHADGTRFADTRAYDFERTPGPMRRRPGGRPVERCLHGCWWTDDGELALYAGQTTGTTALGDRWRFADGPGPGRGQSCRPARNLYARARHRRRDARLRRPGARRRAISATCGSSPTTRPMPRRSSGRRRPRPSAAQGPS